MADDPQSAPKRPRGRPRVPDPKPGCTVSSWMPASEYDKLIQKANAHDISVSKFVRVCLRQQLKLIK